MLVHELHPVLSSWVAELESRLALQFAHEDDALRSAGEILVRSRGKRLRPVVLLLSCACFGDVTSRALDQAVLLELIHTASLAHDDVVDEATSRRGEPSAPTRWGTKFSVLLGDFLLARVFQLATMDSDSTTLRLLGETATTMGRAVVLELARLNLNADEALYWEVIRGKTAALFAMAAEVGARLGGASEEWQAEMRQFGEAFGLAFQLADDLLDLQGSGHETGKPWGIDWQQRHATLPVIVALRQASPADAEMIRRIWMDETFSVTQYFSLRSLLEASGGFEYGWRKVKQYQETAHRCLLSAPAGPGRDALMRLCLDTFPLPILPS